MMVPHSIHTERDERTTTKVVIALGGNALMEAGGTAWAVALVGGLEQRFPQYRCVDRCTYDGGEGTVTWYLYRRQ